MEFRLLTANEIDARVGQVGNGYCTLLLYKDARVDMDILDETVGSERWQRKHYEVKGNMYCSVGIYFPELGWVWKDDCGTESNTEKEKGESSDSFKRACVNWGIGRELYTAPIIKINCKTEDKKIKDLTSFAVKNIEYDNKVIVGLEITAYNKENKTTDTVFNFGTCKATKGKNQSQNKVPFEDVKSEKKMKLEEALEIEVATRNGYKKLKELTDEQLRIGASGWQSKEWVEGANLILLYKAGQNA